MSIAKKKKKTCCISRQRNRLMAPVNLYFPPKARTVNWYKQWKQKCLRDVDFLTKINSSVWYFWACSHLFRTSASTSHTLSACEYCGLAGCAYSLYLGRDMLFCLYYLFQYHWFAHQSSFLPSMRRKHQLPPPDLHVCPLLCPPVLSASAKVPMQRLVWR